MADKSYLAFIGTNSVRGSKGIYSVRIDGKTLQPAIMTTHQVYNTGAVALRNDRLYAASEGMTFKGLADGGVYAYAIDPSGELTEIGAARSHGQRTCAVDVDTAGKTLYGCNFYRGTFAAWDLDANGAPQPARMVVAPPDDAGSFRALHCVKAIGSDYVGVISLAECALVIYRASSGERVTSFPFPNSPFCRYLEVVGTHIYALMQDPGDVYVFRNRLDENGTVEHLQTISVLPERVERFGTTTLRATPNGKLLLVATRNTNTLTVFHIREDGTLALASVVPLPGKTPRDFAISDDGRIVVSCLQRTDEICVHTIDYEAETLRDTGHKLSIPSPAAAAVRLV